MSIIVQIAFLAVTLYVAHCYQIVINELNIDNPVEPERHEFVELVGYDNEGKMVNKGSLRGYKMLLISSYQSGSKGPTIELVANLYNANIKNSFFVLGGFDVPNTSMTVESNMVASRKKLMRNQGILNWMTNANEHLFAVVLVHSINSTDLSRLWLSKSQPYLNLKDHVQTIKHHLKDIVVYGRRAPQERCGIFEELNPNFTETKYVLREFDGGSKDFSLNRCTLETRPMLPKSFKLGKPTPGSTNDCSGTRFILEETILEMQEQLVELRRAIAEAIATQNSAKRQLDKYVVRSKEWHDRARLALAKGNEELARAALQRRQPYQSSIGQLQAQIDQQKTILAGFLRDLSDLENQINLAKAKKNDYQIRARSALATKKIAESFEKVRSASILSEIEVKVIEKESYRS